MKDLPDVDPFMGEQQGLFSGGPSDPDTAVADLASSEHAHYEGAGAEPAPSEATAADPAAAAPGKAAASESQSEPSESELLRERVDSQEKMIERMLTGQQQQQAPAQPPAQQLAPPGPQPDAVTKPAEFTAWLDQKMTYERALTERATNVRDQRQEAASRLDRLWQTYQKDHPDAAGDEDLVAAAFQKVVQNNGGQMPGDTTAMLGSVAKQVRAWTGGKKPDANRTQGVGAGKGARRPSKSPAAETEKIPTFAEQLGTLQQKTGFF